MAARRLASFAPTPTTVEGRTRTWVVARPIVIDVPGGPRRTSDAEHVERNLYRAARRTARAAEAGVRRYEKVRRRSARRERDGAVVDLLPNVARGVAATAGRLAPVPVDLARAATPRSVRRITRRSVRAAARATR